ncbi:MAG: Esterase, depolymerase [Ramlibacter sp.]|nr:Esterase, depolymerase [Ramlibacter sp.]
MTFEFQKLMQQATRLTQSGDLQAATAAIQAALGAPTAAVAASAANDARIATEAIDVETREVPDASPSLTGQGSAEVQSPGGTAPGSPAQFIAGSFSMPAGQRDYKLYIPAGAAAGDKPLPLVVMLHGCTQTPDDFAAGTAMNDAAQAQGCYVLYPAQSQQANPQRCWNWFKHSHQQRGRGEPALLAGMTQQVMAQHRIDPERVYVAGLSAGGAMAAILGDTYPDLYAAVGVHSGLAAGAASDLPSAMAAMQGNGKRVPVSAGKLPTIVFHGDADSTVHPRNGEQVTAASSDGAITPASEQHQQPGGRRSTRHVHRDAGGKVLAEHWVVHGAPHAWAGGSARGSYTDARGPDATAEMLRFFLEHPRA